MQKYIRTIMPMVTGLVIMNLTGCASSNNANSAFRNIDTNGYTVTYPESVSGALHNRGMGWISLEEQTELGKLDLGKNGTLPEVDNIGIQTSWALIEKTPGNYDWSLIDQTIDYWTRLGKRINFRICTDSLNLPEVFYGAPAWLNSDPYNVPYEEYTYSGAVKARVNDLTNATYKEHFELFMEALATRYKDNPYLDTIDIRGYGMFSEWHSGHSFATMEERMFTLSYIVDVYAREFAQKGKTLFLSNSWDYQGVNDDGSSAATEGNCAYEDYLIWSAFDHAMKLQYVSYRRDGMAGNGVTKYGTDEKLLVELIKSGKKVGNAGEFFSGFENYINNLYGMDPLEAIEELVFKSRCNYATVMGWVNIEVANIDEAGYEEVFNRGNEKMGYRLKVNEAKFPTENSAGDQITVKTQFANSSVGRFTLADHKIAFYLIDGNNQIKQTYINDTYDLRILLNGEIGNVYTTFTLDKNLAKGDYTLAIAIVDENKQPAIRLAQVGNYNQKIYPLGTLRINSSSQLKAYFVNTTYTGLTDFTFKANSKYEVTFDYTPSFKLTNYEFGNDNGYVATLTSKKGGNSNTIQAAIFKDVSEESATKTIVFTTGNYDDYKLSITGTGEYAGTISLGKVIIEERTGYLEKFENGYDLYSTRSTWYTDSYYASIIDDQALSNQASVLIESDDPHAAVDGIKSDPSLLALNKNSSYSISFKTIATQVGGNGSYYYIRLYDKNGLVKSIGEWYDRPDEGAMYKEYSFTTTDSSGFYIAFGIKNGGAYCIDELNILQNENGQLIKGADVANQNNVRPYDSEKGINYIEGFESMVLNDSTFTYGFNRWGSLTKDEAEVISGNYSLTSRVDPAVYKYNPENNWYEFAYSNSKYIKLSANTSYRLRFSYRVVEDIYLNTDPTSRGYGYFLARSRSGVSADTDAQIFAGSTIIKGDVKTAIFNFTTGAADDYYLVLGLYGRGIVIIDDISITLHS